MCWGATVVMVLSKHGGQAKRAFTLRPESVRDQDDSPHTPIHRELELSLISHVKKILY